MIKLKFGKVANHSLPTTLKFGTVISVAFPLSLDAYMPEPEPMLGNTGALSYESRTARGVAGRVDAHFQDAIRFSAPVETRFQPGVPLRSPIETRWQDARSAHQAVGFRWQDGLRVRQPTESSYQDALPYTPLGILSRYQEGVRTQRLTTARYQDSLRLNDSATRGSFQRSLQAMVAVTGRYQDSLPLQVASRHGFQQSLPFMLAWVSRYQDSIVPPPGIWDGTGGGGPTDPTDPDPVTIVVPVQAAYIMQNNVLLMTWPGGDYIEADSVQLSLDFKSWTWSFSAVVPPKYRALLTRTDPKVPVLLQVEVNGATVRVAVDYTGRTRTFYDGAIQVTGRGVSAVLGDPYAPSMTFKPDGALSGEQLANYVLSYNGVPIGWDVIWSLPDIAAPEGSWSFQGTYADALANIATSVGGYVQPHHTDQVIRMLKLYPSLPWEWADQVANFELPSAVVEVEGVTDVDKPEYNRVFVNGMTSGMSVRVTRAATAGDLPAPDVTNALISSINAARGKGEAILADTGSQQTVSLKLPVLTATGFIVPGNLVRYVDGAKTYLGMSRSIEIQANQQESWQTITLETHV